MQGLHSITSMNICNSRLAVIVSLGCKKSPDWKKKASLTKEFCNASNENKTKETLNFL